MTGGTAVAGAVGDLAETGGSSSTPYIAGAAAVLPAPRSSHASARG
ncbi:LAETG motif-containing sortase-dependent surface protein [Streptomyces sp. NPDC005791]